MRQSQLASCFMKSSDSGHKRGRLTKCLIVDGYNILARYARKSLRDIEDLESARERLIDDLAEYGRFVGEAVVVVFDAHQRAEPATAYEQAGIQVIYTGANETADERIERLVYEFKQSYKEIMVATSDLAEQQVAFGGGALRIPASELVRKIGEVKRVVRHKLSDDPSPVINRLSDTVRQDVANILEKWRRQ